jgi:cytochrome c-type protein NapB
VKKTLRISIAIIGLAALALALALPAVAQSTLESLRGPVAIPDTAPAQDIRKQNTSSGRFDRAYRQQPPLIPHRVDKYQIDLNANQCMRCHDWPFHVEEGATKISETHYFDRNGVALDQVSGTRWFCTQCHVPQADARPLVPSTFKSATEVE